MRIRAKLTLLLLALGAAAVLVTSAVGYFYAQRSLTDRVLDQLVSVNHVQRFQLQSYFKDITEQVRSFSEGMLAAQGMREFRDAVERMDSAQVPAPLRAEVERYYAQNYLPQLSRFMPLRSQSAEYMPVGLAPYLLQDEYIVRNPHKDRAQLEDPRDGSAYSRVHAKYHALYRRITERFGYSDLYLIDRRTGRIVYSVRKDPDFGTSLRTGPYRSSHLAKIFEQCHSAKDVETVVMSDFEAYEPSNGAPAAFLCSPVYSEGDENIDGVFALQLSIREVDDAISSERGWERAGLGKTGESRVVGSDFLMRSNARGFIENPGEYLRAIGERGVPRSTVEKIRAYNTTVLQQPLKLPSVEAALRGQEGTIHQVGATGRRTLVAYAPMNVPGLQWSIETRIEEDEALAPVHELRSRLLWVTVLILIGLALAASVIGRKLVRPIQSLSSASERITQGDLSARVPVGSRDEIGILSGSFNHMADAIERQTEEIRRKNQENESLLLNILPSPIADRLKSGEQRIADSFAEVTVLFADIVNFTVLSSDKPAAETVELLNDLFSRFDAIAQRAGVEKIKTIGDAYMAVSGLPDPCNDHTLRMANMARELMDETHRYGREHAIDLDLRIGLNCGPVVAGVIGSAKFIYDLWGDTVNVASRMESHGVPGCIQVTRPVYEQLQSHFTFEPRGEIEVKGKGRLEAWLLVAAVEREAAAV